MGPALGCSDWMYADSRCKMTNGLICSGGYEAILQVLLYH